jgi:hypothetical protein
VRRTTSAVAVLLVPLLAHADPDPQADLARVRALTAKAKWTEARTALRKSLELHGKHGWLWTELSLVELRAGDPAAAVTAATTALELPGDHMPAAAYNLSLAWEKQGDLEKALAPLRSYGFVSAAMADREAALAPPDPVVPAWTGAVQAIPSVAGWCKAHRKANPTAPAEPASDTGPTTHRCSSKASSLSPKVDGLGQVGIATTTRAWEFRAYEHEDTQFFLVRDGKEIVPLAMASSGRDGSHQLDRFRWEVRDVVPGGAPELLLSARVKDSTDYNEARMTRGTMDREDELVWVVGLDDAGRLAAFGPVPRSRQEVAAPGFDDSEGTEVPLGKPWRQAWKFDLAFEDGAIVVGGNAVPRRDRHRLGRFPVRFVADR